MKLLTTILLTLFFTHAKAQKKSDKETKPFVVTVDYVLRNDDGSGEIWAKTKVQSRSIYYQAITTKPIPDSIKQGKKLTLISIPENNKDTCGIVFNWVRVGK